MSKKDTTAIPQHVEKKPAKKEQLIPLTLVMCDWKNDFPGHQCKVMIAEALNYCVYNEGMEISGYLITRRRLCLVLLADPAHVHNLLRLFYKELRKEILRHTHLLRNPGLTTAQRIEVVEEEKQAPLFILYRLQNYMLVALITGQQVDLPYYSPYLARLQDKISIQNFCSAVDYSGAKSPVVVTMLNNKQNKQ